MGVSKPSVFQEKYQKLSYEELKREFDRDTMLYNIMESLQEQNKPQPSSYTPSTPMLSDYEYFKMKLSHVNWELEEFCSEEDWKQIKGKKGNKVKLLKEEFTHLIINEKRAKGKLNLGITELQMCVLFLLGLGTIITLLSYIDYIGTVLFVDILLATPIFLYNAWRDNKYRKMLNDIQEQKQDIVEQLKGSK